MSESNQSVIAAYDKHAQSLAEANTANKQAVFTALKAAGIATVNVQFNGAGDSGQIEEITACADGTAVALPEAEVEMRHASWDGAPTNRKMSLREAIEELCFDYLSQEHGGWEIDDGGQGEFTFRCEDSSIDLEFQQFYTDSTSHSHTF
jgi:hypothetical protein